MTVVATGGKVVLEVIWHRAQSMSDTHTELDAIIVGENKRDCMGRYVFLVDGHVPPDPELRFKELMRNFRSYRFHKTEDPDYLSTPLAKIDTINPILRERLAELSHQRWAERIRDMLSRAHSMPEGGLG